MAAIAVALSNVANEWRIPEITGTNFSYLFPLSKEKEELNSSSFSKLVINFLSRLDRHHNAVQPSTKPNSFLPLETHVEGNAIRIVGYQNGALDTEAATDECGTRANTHGVLSEQVRGTPRDNDTFR
jgi:hypothetical protein